MAVLGAAPGPNAGPRLTLARVQALLRHAGRQRYVAARSGGIVEALHSPQLSARPGIAAACTATRAARAPANRLVGILHGCLRHHTTYNEDTAWHTTTQNVQLRAA